MPTSAKKKTFDKEQFLNASMTIAAKEGWKNLTPNTVAIAIGLSQHELPPYLKTKEDILLLFEECIMAELKDCYGHKNFFSPDEPMKDRLFDILMERFDLMLPYRKGLKTLPKSLPSTPMILPKSLIPIRQSMKKILSWAGGTHACPKNEIKIFGLSLVYLKTARLWLKDDTKDLSKTMAELDKNLGFAEQAANSLKL